ncbi:tyrosinase-like protein 2 [Mytilus californianus]|uniref:tyrosinase-like protein 2 n=1 Tax=Mytilus californianus TaxID=6549 RepID=UPI0022471157|nr:tyrosinase-like protein 2 [Mytilus californianus]
MKHALVILVVLLCDSGFLTVSEVITSQYPGIILECRDQDAEKEYKCILSKFDNPGWIPDKEHDIQLRVRQDFFWHPTKRIRRECRQLTREEFKEMVDAINTLKNDKSLFPSVYDFVADYHTNEAVKSVHFGSNFFGWHKMYILKFEELLRRVNPNVTLCYWDSRLDHHMRDPTKSVMFTSDFFGNGKGPIKVGPFAGWKTIRNIPLVRDLGKTGKPISYKFIDGMLSKKHHFQITTPTSDPDTNVENMHNLVHAFIGGQMNNFNTSSQDPFFWIHHAFIDAVWEKFCQQLRHRNIDPQDDYTIIDSLFHKPYRFMDRLFPMRNIDGYSDYFSNHIYKYDEFAKCPSCLNSPFLKCDYSSDKCVSIEANEPRRRVLEPLRRITTNHLSTPQNGLTVLSGDENDWVYVPIKIIVRNALHKFIRKNVIAGCEYLGFGHDNLCSKSMAIVQSNGITYHGTYRSYIVNDVSIPQWVYAFVGIKNPGPGMSQAFISVTDKYNKPCEPFCLDMKARKYHSCPGVISLTSTEPEMFSRTLMEAYDSGFSYNPLEVDTLNPNIKLSFLCY